jgi:hypothetical protein
MAITQIPVQKARPIQAHQAKTPEGGGTGPQALTPTELLAVAGGRGVQDAYLQRVTGPAPRGTNDDSI